MPWLSLALKAGPWIVAALAIGFGLFERGNYEGEKAGRVADALAAQQAADKKIGEAKVASDAALAEREQKIAALSTTTTTYVDRIIHDTPSTCAPSPAARDAARGVRSLLANPVGGPTAK